MFVCYIIFSAKSAELYYFQTTNVSSCPAEYSSVGIFKRIYSQD
jgi:hypothetical protein